MPTIQSLPNHVTSVLCIQNGNGTGISEEVFSAFLLLIFPSNLNFKYCTFHKVYIIIGVEWMFVFVLDKC